MQIILYGEGIPVPRELQNGQILKPFIKSLFSIEIVDAVRNQI